MKKALILTTTSGFLSQFELNNVKLLQERGYQIHYATNFGVPIYEVKDEALRDMGVILHHISIEKSPFKLKKNFWALRELIRIIDREQIEVVHCHNPNGGVLGRLAAALSKRKPYVIYTAHGFHFFQGASVINWLFYYPVEKMLAKLSDIIITINHEDYMRASSFSYKENGSAQLIPGVGINKEIFNPDDQSNIAAAQKLREIWNVPKDAFHIVSAGELNKNKNHKVVIEALARLSRDNIYYSICGEGPYRAELEKLIKKLGLSGRVFLRGYRNDMQVVWHTADLSIFPSHREGMGMAALEAMACGIPIIVADNRGTREYLSDGNNGFVCDADLPEEFAGAILRMYENAELRTALADNALATTVNFTLQRTESRMREIYSKLPKYETKAGDTLEKQPMISVIMGVYNQIDLEAFEKAVNSVLNQTYKDFEFLIYNDGSSIAEVNAYIDLLEKKDPRIHVIHSVFNHGLGYALNRCIDAAKGRYLARMDADDVSHPNRFEVEVEFLESHPEYMWCGSNCELFDQKGQWGNSTRPENPGVHDYLKYSPYIHPTVMYRAGLFEAVAGYAEEKNTKRCEDYELFMRLFKLGYKGYNIQEELLNYRVDRKSYHTRPFRDCWRELKVRYEGYKSLGVLWPDGWLYVLRPMASAIVPKRLVMHYKERGAEL
mgnify:CR=1 FL=1